MTRGERPAPEPEDYRKKRRTRAEIARGGYTYKKEGGGNLGWDEATELAADERGMHGVDECRTKVAFAGLVGDRTRKDPLLE